MGNSTTKNKDNVPTVEVTFCTVHEYIASRIKNYGSKVAQVDARTGESISFAAVLERAAALAAGLTSRGLRPGEVAMIIGENNIHYPWVLLGVLQTGASAHLIDPRSTSREVEHALSISRPTTVLVSAAVGQQDDVTRLLRKSGSVRNLLVWNAGGANVHGDVGADLPDGIASLEQLIVSPAKSASSTCSSPDTSYAKMATSPSGDGRNADAEVTVPAVQDVARGLAQTPSAPPPTPTSLGATYGDSCSPFTPTASPLQKILVHAVDGVPQQPPGGSSVAFILSSSGSTGLPKGVMLTHENLLAALELGPIFIHPDDVVGGLSPYFHAYGGLLMLMALCAGTTMVALGRFSMKSLLDAVEQYKITVLHVVSSLLVSMVKLPADDLARLKPVRRLWSGAAQISPLVQSALQSRLPDTTLAHSYGMTETTFTTFCGEMRADKPGSPGTLAKAMECKVIDPETGKSQPMGARGELCFRGPMVMRGYLGNAEATNEALDAEGWLHSGDLGFVDEDGYYYIVERLKDILKYNGHQVSPSELEALLMTHPAVSEAAVIGEPHEYGDAPRALVLLAAGQSVTEEELQSFIAGKVAPHKQLRGGITFITSPFPRTASGKLQRKRLRGLLSVDDSTASSTTTDDSISSPTTAEDVGKITAAVEEVTLALATEQFAPSSSTPTQPEKSTTQEQWKGKGADQMECEVSPVFVAERQYRPSIASVVTLSTIYSQSPLSSPVDVKPDDDSAFATPSSIVALREASQVPLPPSDPNSPAEDFARRNTEGSLGSCQMDLTSPMGGNIVQQESEENSYSYS